MSLEKNLMIVYENYIIYRDKYYINSKGEKVELGDIVDKSIDNTEVILDSKDLWQELSNYCSKRNKKYTVRENIKNIGVIDCIVKLRKDGIKGNIIALNFASATNPGGGYLNGSTAQEESICRGSLLYESISLQKDFYKYNVDNYTPLYNDNMIYTPDMAVIRNDKNELLDNYEIVSFITSPAVNKNCSRNVLIEDDIINEAMDRRIKKILELAVSKKPSAIVLGAYGCGVFGNDREFVYDTFEKYINELVPDKIKVYFAVYDRK